MDQTPPPHSSDPSSPSGPPPPPPAGNGGSGLAPNVAGALSYLLGPITGILFLVVEKNNRFVRFHAAQSIGISVAWVVFWVVVSVVTAAMAAVPVIGWIISILVFFISLLLGLGGLVLWLFLMYQAWNGNEWEFPWVGAKSREILVGGSAN